MSRELRLKQYERNGVKRVNVSVFVDGVGGKGYDIPMKDYMERVVS